MDEIFPKHKLKISTIFADLEAIEIDETIALLKRIGYKASNL